MRSKRVADYARQVRLQLGMRPVELARRMGLWQRDAKGAARIDHFEAIGEVPAGPFNAALCEALSLDLLRIDELLAEDERDYQRWLDEPVPMELVVRRMPSIYLTYRVPQGLSREAAIEWALDQARQAEKYKMCLHLSRRERVWIREAASSHRVEQVQRGTEHLPCMSFGGAGVRIRG